MFAASIYFMFSGRKKRGFNMVIFSLNIILFAACVMFYSMWFITYLERLVCGIEFGFNSA